MLSFTNDSRFQVFLKPNNLNLKVGHDNVNNDFNTVGVSGVANKYYHC